MPEVKRAPSRQVYDNRGTIKLDRSIRNAAPKGGDQNKSSFGKYLVAAAVLVAVALFFIFRA